MKALVTGAAGFVGSKITETLLAEGEEVIGLDSMSDYYDVDLKRRNVMRNANRNYKFVQADLNRAPLEELLLDVDVIFHQAGQPGVRKSWGDDFTVYTRANVDATQRLLEAANAVGTVRKIVYASSSSVYGDSDTFPTKESAPTRPQSPYGVTKLAGEHLCSLYAANFGLPTVSLRYFTVYGPCQRPDMAFTRFARAAISGEAINIFGSGHQVRDFTYINDIVAANLAAARLPTTPGAVYNIAGGGHTSMLEVLTLLSEISGRKLKIVKGLPVAGDVWRTGGDTARAERDLAWSPRVRLPEGLEAQYKWALQSTSYPARQVHVAAAI